MRKVSLVLTASLMAFALLGMNSSPAEAAIPDCQVFKILPTRVPDISYYPTQGISAVDSCTVEWIYPPWFKVSCTDCYNEWQQSGCGICVDLYGCAIPACHGRPAGNNCE